MTDATATLKASVEMELSALQDELEDAQVNTGRFLGRAARMRLEVIRLEGWEQHYQQEAQNLKVKLAAAAEHVAAMEEAAS